jgi:hypothetical protein
LRIPLTLASLLEDFDQLLFQAIKGLLRAFNGKSGMNFSALPETISPQAVSNLIYPR